MVASEETKLEMIWDHTALAPQQMHLKCRVMELDLHQQTMEM
jgi:hypothetical protein